MILDKKPLSLPEVVDTIGDSDKAKEMKKFIKTFNKMKVEDALKMKEELLALDLIQLKEEHLVSLINFVPVNATELNKVLQGVSLNQEEVEKILNVTKNY